LASSGLSAYTRFACPNNIAMRSRAISFVEGFLDLSFNACLRLPVANTIAASDKK